MRQRARWGGAFRGKVIREGTSGSSRPTSDSHVPTAARDQRELGRLIGSVRPGAVGPATRYGVTVTVAEALTVPPMPVQVRVYVHNPVAAGTSRCLPLTASVPFQPPVASQDSA